MEVGRESVGAERASVGGRMVSLICRWRIGESEDMKRGRQENKRKRKGGKERRKGKEERKGGKERRKGKEERKGGKERRKGKVRLTGSRYELPRLDIGVLCKG
jgi:hypothetical protein